MSTPTTATPTEEKDKSSSIEQPYQDALSLFLVQGSMQSKHAVVAKQLLDGLETKSSPIKRDAQSLETWDLVACTNVQLGQISSALNAWMRALKPSDQPSVPAHELSQKYIDGIYANLRMLFADQSSEVFRTPQHMVSVRAKSIWVLRTADCVKNTIRLPSIYRLAFVVETDRIAGLRAIASSSERKHNLVSIKVANFPWHPTNVPIVSPTFVDECFVLDTEALGIQAFDAHVNKSKESLFLSYQVRQGHHNVEEWQDNRRIRKWSSFDTEVDDDDFDDILDNAPPVDVHACKQHAASWPLFSWNHIMYAVSSWRPLTVRKLARVPVKDEVDMNVLVVVDVCPPPAGLLLEHDWLGCVPLIQLPTDLVNKAELPASKSKQPTAGQEAWFLTIVRCRSDHLWVVLQLTVPGESDPLRSTRPFTLRITHCSAPFLLQSVNKEQTVSGLCWESPISSPTEPCLLLAYGGGGAGTTVLRIRAPTLLSNLDRVRYV